MTPDRGAAGHSAANLSVTGHGHGAPGKFIEAVDLSLSFGSTPALRSDFSETLYWHPVLVLPDGKGEVSFELCDSVTTFQVTAFAHTLDGRLGAATRKIESRLPFTLSPKLPLEVTASDRLEVPLDEIAKFENYVQTAIAANTQTIDLDSLPGEEALMAPGRKDGDIKVVRSKNKGGRAHGRGSLRQFSHAECPPTMQPWCTSGCRPT